MKKRIALLFTALFFIGIQVISAQTSQKRDLSAFSEISLRISANVHLQQGNSQTVEVKGKEESLQRLVAEVKDRKLIIRFPSDTWFNKWNPGPIDLYVTIPQVDGLAISGSGSITSEGKIESRILDLAISGSGDIKLNELRAEKVTAALSGSGNIHLSGKESASELKAFISGSGNVKAIDLPASSVEIKISGSGNCWVNAIKSLNVRLSGSGNVTYRGNPAIDTNTSGTGKVRTE